MWPLVSQVWKKTQHRQPVWQWERKKEMKDGTQGGNKTRKERGRARARASERDDYVDCLPHPPFRMFFFPYSFFLLLFLLLLHYSPKKHCFSARNRINQHSPLQHGSRSSEETPCPIGAAPELLSQWERADEAGVTATCFLTPLCKSGSHTGHGGCRREATAEGRFVRTDGRGAPFSNFEGNLEGISSQSFEYYQKGRKKKIYLICIKKCLVCTDFYVLLI